MEVTFDLSRPPSTHRIPGGDSFHFGPTDQNGVPLPYDYPGGAYGTLQSKTFSLEGYSPHDKPTLYFTYFLESENEIHQLYRVGAVAVSPLAAVLFGVWSLLQRS